MTSPSVIAESGTSFRNKVEAIEETLEMDIRSIELFGEWEDSNTKEPIWMDNQPLRNSIKIKDVGYTWFTADVPWGESQELSERKIKPSENPVSNSESGYAVIHFG